MMAAVRRGVPFDVALDRGLAALPERDKRLAHELAAGILRQSGALDQVIAPFVPRGISSVAPELLDVLRLGAYQLRHLERVPPHAAVATSVALAREVLGERAAGFANAVLRRVSELGPDAPTDQAVDLISQLAATWSHPAWLVARWLERFGAADTEALLEWNNTHPALVVQPARGGSGDLERLFRDEDVRSFAAPYGAGIVVDATRPERLPGFDRGMFYVQDPAQAMVLRFADFAPGALVFDACAAPGGKTLGLARNAVGVVAADASRRRLQRLRENLRRAGHGHEFPLVADALHPPVRPVAAYLLDAPCLGTGTFARHPDARLRVTAEALTRLAQEQAALLDAAADRVAPGGVLCYATCSLEPEEDASQVEAFLARHRDFRREPTAAVPSELLSADGDLEVLPQRHGMDGAFAARLVRIA
ncbi:MAG: transcription antitermination factor NusB [Gemmatimonadota bacterium]